MYGGDGAAHLPEDFIFTLFTVDTDVLHTQQKSI